MLAELGVLNIMKSATTRIKKLKKCHSLDWTLATFLYSLAFVFGHCISHQLTGTIAAPKCF